jgi:hypothetical protein
VSIVDIDAASRGGPVAQHGQQDRADQDARQGVHRSGCREVRQAGGNIATEPAAYEVHRASQ